MWRRHRREAKRRAGRLLEMCKVATYQHCEERVCNGVIGYKLVVFEHVDHGMLGRWEGCGQLSDGILEAVLEA